MRRARHILLTGDELDGPRGRIYLIKEMLEADAPTSGCARSPRSLPDVPGVRNNVPVWCGVRRTRGDRPQLSGRTRARDRHGAIRARLAGARVARAAAARFFCAAWPVVSLGVARVPRARSAAYSNRARRWPRKIIRAASSLLDGCVQRAATPEVNAALARVLDASDVKMVRAGGEGCCGSLELHLGRNRARLRRFAPMWMRCTVPPPKLRRSFRLRADAA